MAVLNQHKGSTFSNSLREVSTSELLMWPVQLFNANQNCANVEPSRSMHATVSAAALGAVRMRTCSPLYLKYTPRYKCSVLFRDDCLRMQPFDKARLAMHQVQSWLYNHFVRFSLRVPGQGEGGREVWSPAHEDDRDEDDTDTNDQCLSALIQREINSKFCLLYALRTKSV